MITRMVEVTNGPANWGKFMVGVFDATDITRPSLVDTESRRPLLQLIGFSPSATTVMVMDLQTSEGALFKLGGSAGADLNKHRVWVCPMFEPFLAWLYANWRGIENLPPFIDLPDAPFSMTGYRRPGQ